MRLEIRPDEHHENTRKEFNHLGHIVSFHRRYNLEDKPTENWHNRIDEVKEHEEQMENDPKWVILPLYLYDHGGISISTTPFSCPWDSGKLGFIYAKADAEGMTREQVEACLEAEIVELDQYLRGDVWGCTIYDDNDEGVDSCWGFYGREYAETEGAQMLKDAIERENKQRDQVAYNEAL